MGFAFVNEAHELSFPSSAIPTATLSITQGNLLVAWLYCGNSLVSPNLQISDGVNIWVPIALNQAGGFGYTYAWFAIAKTTASVTVEFFTTTQEGGPPAGIISGTAPAPLEYPICQVMQFSGQWGSNPMESYTFASGNSTVPASPITTSGTHDLVVGIAGPPGGGVILGGGSGWTNAAGSGTDYSAVYEIMSSTGTYTPLFSASPSGSWGALSIAFKAASDNTNHTISGSLGSAGAGANVLFMSQTSVAFYTATANGSGNYTSPGLADDTYTVSPQIVGTTYAPVNQTVSGSNVTLNFSGTSVPTSLAFTQLIADSFTRANENPLSNGGTWVADGTPIPPYDPPGQVLSNQCVMSDATIYANYAGPWAGDMNALWDGNGAVLPANQWIEVQIATLNSAPSHYSNVSLYIRGGAGTGYGCVVSNNGGGTANVILFYFATNGASSTPQNTPLYGFFPFGVLTLQNVPFSLNDTFRIAALGTTLYILHNGTIIGNYTDSSLSSGYPSLVLAGTAISDAAIVNFKGGSLAQSTGIPGAMMLTGCGQ